MRGIVTIKKVFSDGREEVVATDDNVISVGLAESFVNLFSNNLAGNTSNVLAGYFQVGDGDHLIDGIDGDTKKYVYSLANPFVESDYGASTTAEIDVHNQVYGIKGNFVPDGPTVTLRGAFVNLPDEFSTKVTDDSVYYRLNIGEKVANGKSLNEFGLFSRNPAGNKKERSVMIAYKSLDAPITKSELFSVVIDWQLKFIDEVEEIGTTTPLESDAPGEGFNVVLIMADDLGIDQLGMYDDMNFYDLSSPQNANAIPQNSHEQPTNGSSIYPQCPILSSLASKGITFKNAHANAMCTPTRANILTGKHAFSSPKFAWEDENGDILYKGMWGTGIGSVATQNFQKLRGGIKGLGRRYVYKNEEGDPTFPELDILGGDATDQERDTWYSTWTNKEFIVPNGYPNAGFVVQPNFTILPDILRDTDYVPNAYKSAMCGKWHLAEWDGLYVYSEEGVKAKGNGWKHIRTVGRFDKVRAMFHNLNKTPIPGHNGDTPNLTYTGAWTDGLGGEHQRYYDLSDTNMGYVNYFQYKYDDYTSDASTLITVSDTGYTTFKFNASAQAAGSTGADNPYFQGDASSYATNKTFADASSLFDTLEEPFFLYVPLNTPHSPYTYPPSGYSYSNFYNNNHAQKQYTSGVGDTISNYSWINQNAMIENMDFMLGEFLEKINPARSRRTLFVFMGDNGSDGSIMQSYYNFSKQMGNTASGIGKFYRLGLFPEEFTNADKLGFDDANGIGGQYQYLDVSAGRGGNDNSPSRFKSSVYDRGTTIPFIVSSSFIPSNLQGSSCSAFVDTVDLYSTITDIAGIKSQDLPKNQKYFNDGISFMPLLRGQVNASSHGRQFSYCEVFRPYGNSAGGVTNTGTHSGQIGDYRATNADNYPWTEANNYGLTTEADASGVGNPTIPFERRRGFLLRQTRTQFGNQQIPDYMFDEAGLDRSTAVYGDVPELSGGCWRLVRPTSGPYYDELYHTRNTNFSGIDLLEVIDQIPESLKGKTDSGLAGHLTVEMLKIAGAAGIQNLNNKWWILARIYTKMSQSLSNYLRFRTPLTTTVNTGYEDSPEDEARLAIPSPRETGNRSSDLGEL